MNRITNLILSFFDLIEAEGRSFRIQTERMLRGIMVLFFGGVLLTAALLAAVFGLYTMLVFFLGVSGAAFAAALILATCGMALIKKGLATEHRQNAAQPEPPQNQEKEAASDEQTK